LAVGDNLLFSSALEEVALSLAPESMNKLIRRLADPEFGPNDSEFGRSNSENSQRMRFVIDQMKKAAKIYSKSSLKSKIADY
jgi:hypothetical protein